MTLATEPDLLGIHQNQKHLSAERERNLQAASLAPVPTPYNPFTHPATPTPRPKTLSMVHLMRRRFASGSFSRVLPGPWLTHPGWKGTCSGGWEALHSRARCRVARQRPGAALVAVRGAEKRQRFPSLFHVNNKYSH